MSGCSELIRESGSGQQIDVEMVFVEGGTFSTHYDENEIFPPPVLLGDYYIGKYPVTQKLWKQVMDGSNFSHFRGDDLPVETVSWDDTQKFIKKLNIMTGKKYRLPAEAEWRFAAAGGKEGKGYKYSGSDDIDDVAWCSENSDAKTHPVGTKKPNELGIYDMNGNVWEWFADEFGVFKAQTDSESFRTVPDRIFSGGSWVFPSRDCRVSNPSISIAPSFRYFDLGFRLALSV
ncbi:MAG: formylglycine-generating enzyme family protein [Chitinispirillales bacterium]|jgi:formylglycine-generating enzyme required for sulfatase activity|nr:formylglycine-generating enzyme family protein [Chitinispirillales bacterium]